VPRPIVIVPLHDHGGTVCKVLDGILESGLHTVVIDDGSTDDGPARVGDWIARNPGQCSLIRLGVNRGKAAAILRGLDEAVGIGAKVAITIDADAQHDPAFLGAFEQASAGHDPTLVLGNRGPITSTYPLARLVGRTLSGLAVRAACGADVNDAACGFRAYPIDLARQVRCLSGRYAWEEEIIARMIWLGVNVREVPLPVIYHQRSRARSHYRFARDWPEGLLVLACVVIQRVIDPSARWSRSGVPARAIAWPFVRGASRAALLGVISLGVASTMAALGTLTLPNSTGVWIASTAIALATIRTRAPVVAAILGMLCGFMLPPTVMAAFSIPAAGILAVFWIAVRRARD
jgi:hypothetical protein